MFELLMVGLGVLLVVAFVKYTVVIHQTWAEGEGERLGLDPESRGFGTILAGRYEGVPLWLALSGRRVTEGEAKFQEGLEEPAKADFLACKELFGSMHFKSDAVWADFPRSKAGEDPGRYADALAVVAAFASGRSLDELYRIDQEDLDHDDCAGAAVSDPIPPPTVH